MKMIPSDFEFDASATPPLFASSTGEKIERGTKIRIKMMGVRAEVNQMYGIGTIKEDYLGYAWCCCSALRTGC